MKIGLKPLLSLVLLITILVPSITIIAVGMSASRTQALRSRANETAALGHAQAAGFDVVLDKCAATLQTLAHLNEVRQTALGNYGEVKDDITSLFAAAMKANEPFLLNIIIADSNGVIYIDYFENMGLNIPGFEGINDIAKGEVVFSDITPSNSSFGGQSTFYVLTRTADDSGYICMIYSTELFTEYLNKNNFMEENINLFITDRKGASLGIDGGGLKTLGEISAPPLRDLVESVVNASAVSSFTPLNTNAYVGAHGTLSGNKTTLKNNWFWFIVYPVSEIETLSLPILVMIAVVASVSVIWLVFSIIILRRVTSPPREIVKKMRMINNGDLNERLQVKGHDEYSYITKIFNDMLDEILVSGEMHRTISELSDNMLFEWDFKKEILFVSENFLKMFEIETDRATLLNGRFIDSLMSKEDNERFKVDLNKLLRNLDSMHGEYQVATKSGSVIWVSIRAHCVLDRLGELLRVIGVVTNIHSEKMLSLQLSERASYDFLSGLYNRNTFMRELQSEITRSVNNRVGVIFIDVDDFKFVNDKYGHNTGDEIIKRVAVIIKDKLGNAGFAGRFGGDEFVMCVTDEETLNNIDKLAGAVLELFDEGYYAKEFDVTLKIKASLGIAISPEHGRDNETILAAADEAMYYVKKTGKCNYHIYNPEDSVLPELMHSI